MNLALGSVQLGTAYGVAGRGIAVPEDEARAILAYAFRAQIRTLDTAPAYGDIEQRLGALITDLDFDVISKVAPIGGADDHAVADLVMASIMRSRERLGPKLKAVLFHRAEDLLSRMGDAAWKAAETVAGQLRLGVSCYDPQTLIELKRRYPIAVAQLPGNVFDQRLSAPGTCDALAGVEIHVRSVFLQGLLLMPLDAAIARVPLAERALRNWARWCHEHQVRPIAGALAIARGLPCGNVFVVGVDRLAHLQDIVSALSESDAIRVPSLASDLTDVIDPRRWVTHERPETSADGIRL